MGMPAATVIPAWVAREGVGALHTALAGGQLNEPQRMAMEALKNMVGEMHDGKIAVVAQEDESIPWRHPNADKPKVQQKWG